MKQQQTDKSPTPDTVKEDKIIPGLKFKSKNFEMDAEIFKIIPEENKAEVLLTAKDGHEWLERDWNLQHTIWGFENGEYYAISTPVKDEAIYKEDFWGYSLNPEVKNKIIALQKENTRLLEDNEKLKRLLHDLTPGGSEFYNNPERCAKWIAENRQQNHYQLAGQIKTLKAEKKEFESFLNDLLREKCDEKEFDDNQGLWWKDKIRYLIGK